MNLKIKKTIQLEWHSSDPEQICDASDKHYIESELEDQGMDRALGLHKESYICGELRAELTSPTTGKELSFIGWWEIKEERE